MTMIAALTLLVGAAGGLAWKQLRWPGGPLLGALMGAGALHVAVDGAEPLDAGFRVAAQIAVGTMVGAGIMREPFKQLGKIVLPTAVALVMVLGTAGLCGLLLARWSDLDLLTSLMSTTPGGASDVTAIALDLGGAVAIVAAFQVIRQLGLFTVVSVLSKHYLDTPPPAPIED